MLIALLHLFRRSKGYGLTFRCQRISTEEHPERVSEASSSCTVSPSCGEIMKEEEKKEEEKEEEDEAAVVDCPICLDPMSRSDHEHPLQCSRNCRYNFCRNCIASLISSSKDDYMEASDGNMHVKIFLNCPNSRSDLSGSIRDTLLLRRADSVLAGQRRVIEEKKGDGGDDDGGNDDEVMTRSDMHMELAMKDAKVRKAIEEAREKEAEFFGRPTTVHADENDEETLLANGVQSNDESWGVEADLNLGVHDSFHSPAPPPPHGRAKMLQADKTLFSGLDRDSCHSEEQMRLLTHLMTSGDPSQLVKAAQILGRQVTDKTNGTRASSRSSSILSLGRGYRRGSLTISNMSSSSHTSSTKYARRNSIDALIKESQMAKEKHAKRKPVSGGGMAAASLARRLAEIEREADFLRAYPLPVRLPKCIVLTLDCSDDNDNATTTTNLPLKFCNDTWDGTVMDAFCKINIGPFNTVLKNHTRHQGVRNILKSDGPVRVDNEKRRVLVSSIRSNCGVQGVMKGDVVTHMNGLPLVVDDARELENAIVQSARSSRDGTVQLILNADCAIAEALKLRALAAADDY